MKFCLNHYHIFKVLSRYIFLFNANNFIIICYYFLANEKLFVYNDIIQKLNNKFLIITKGKNTMKNIKISQMQGNNGAVKNQFIIKQKDLNGDFVSETFQSYDSIIAIKDYSQGIKKIILDKTYWDYSTTTGKYRNLFLRETKKETQAKIDSGVYELQDLN